MVLIIIGVAAGLLIGLNVNVIYNTAFALYITLVILIIIEALLRNIKSMNEEKNYYKEVLLILCEMTFACLLAYLGEILGISLYLAVILSFGLRIFNDFNFLVKKAIKYDK